MYVCDAGLSPTSTVANPGARWPFFTRSSTAALISVRTLAEIAFPSMMRALTAFRMACAPLRCKGLSWQNGPMPIDVREKPVIPVRTTSTVADLSRDEEDVSEVVKNGGGHCVSVPAP